MIIDGNESQRGKRGGGRLGATASVVSEHGSKRLSVVISVVARG